MWWVRSRAVEVYLGETLVGCKGLDDDAERWADVADVEAGLVQLHAWVSTAKVALRARVWLGSALARPLVIDRHCGARNVDEARALASTSAGEATGLAGDLKVWLGPWRPDQPTLAVATPRPLLAALQSAMSSSSGPRCRVHSVRPWWNQVFDAVLDRSRAQSRTIGWTLVEPEGLVHGRVERGGAIECAFERAKSHDPGFALLRRRLAVGWGAVDEVEHFVFEPRAPAAGGSAPFGIGRAAPLIDSEVAE